MELPALADLAQTAGFPALCMRASQVGVQSSPDAIRRAASLLADCGLRVTMVTGDFAIVYNHEGAAQCLRAIEPHLDLAAALGAPMIRVALKHTDDIPRARRAADQARERGLTLVHQCHVLGLFETVDSIEATLRAIDRENFGLIFEAANLEQCGQDYGPATLARLAPWIRNVYLQNQRLHAGGRVALETWVRGPVRLDVIPLDAPGGIDFEAVFRGLAAIDYQGPVTVHQSAPESGSPLEAALGTARWLDRWIPRRVDQGRLRSSDPDSGG